MPDPPNIIEYAHATIPGEIQLRRHGEWLTIAIPAAQLWSLLLIAIVRAVIHSSLVLLLTSICTMVDESNRPFDPNGLAVGLICFVLPVSVILLLFQLIRAAMSGDGPTIIQASPATLQIAPRGRGGRERSWQSMELVDISVREGGLFPAIARQINLQIVQQADRFETLHIPWNGNGALANIEENLREVLSLPRTSRPASTPPT